MRTLPEPMEEDGGVRVDVNTKAPKTVTDTHITGFSCEFSTFALAEDVLGNRNYQLEATLSGGNVTGSYGSYDRFGSRIKRVLLADAAFMERLQTIVQEHDFACHNGYHTHVSGLPDNYGSSIRITYASGEEIHASDNQDGFLSVEAMTGLEALFYNHSAEISPEEEETL